jgi:hypothetical protein
VTSTKNFNRDLEGLDELFYYDPSSPTGLRRKTDWRSGRKLATVRAKAGDVTGSAGKDYYAVYDGSKLILAHVVIWVLEKGAIPDGHVVDHIDGNGFNNNIDNLRCVNERFNAQNMKRMSTNMSGVCGVHFRESEGHYPRWVAQCYTLENKRASKSFSVEKYGYDEAFRLACEYRTKMIEELNRQGAGYTERHGT